jgi:general stress protein YciG
MTQGKETAMANDRGNDERGFASMSEEERRRIAEKGGEAVSKDREHMSEIGKKGGEASAESRSRDDDSGTRGRDR